MVESRLPKPSSKTHSRSNTFDSNLVYEFPKNFQNKSVQ